MNKFIKKAILFFILIFSIFFITDYLITTGLKKSQSFFFVDWNRIYNSKINADIIINGNSKAWHHISPKILDSIYSTNSYNLGIDGYDFIMQKAKYDVYLNHNVKPKFIIQVVGNQTLTPRKDLFQHIQFSPYINDTIIKNATKHYKGFSEFDLKLPLVRYAGSINILPDSFLSLIGQDELLKDKNKYKGYEGWDKIWDTSFNTFKKNTPKGISPIISIYSLNLFKEYIKRETKKGIKIILIYSPTFHESQNYIVNREDIINTYKNIARENNIPFFDYSSHNITLQKKIFL